MHCQGKKNNNHAHVSIPNTEVASNMRMSTTSPPNFLAVVAIQHFVGQCKRLVVQV